MIIKNYIAEQNIKVFTNKFILIYGENVGMVEDFKKKIKSIYSNSEINIFDPIVKVKDLKKFSANSFNNFKKSIEDSNVIIICNNHEFFSSIDLQSLLIEHTNIKMIYDFWNHFDYLDVSQKKELRYVTYGNHWLFNKQAVS